MIICYILAFVCEAGTELRAHTAVERVGPAIVPEMSVAK